MTHTRHVADFIRARLDEDEAAARLAGATPDERWRRHENAVLEDVPGGGRGAWIAQACEDEETAAHIARHDPARVFADVAAKREIVAWVGDYDADPDGSAWGILGHLAALYADHPDYRQEWRSALDDSESDS